MEKVHRPRLLVSNMTQREKDRLNFALDEARKAHNGRLSREDIREVRNRIKGYILDERRRTDLYKKRKESELAESAEKTFDWSASVQRPIRR
jgi:ribosomal protein S17E